MGNYRITCVLQQNGIITQVGMGGKQYSVSEVVNFMIQGHRFYTLSGNKVATVHKKWSSISDRWYLTTNPDSILENNLDYLPSC